MQITSENLVVVTRRQPDGIIEVLTGKKKRGRFAGCDVLPGGKAEGSAQQRAEAARELREETRIDVPDSALRALGRLIIYDTRPDNQRFGNIFLFTVDVDQSTVAAETDELKPVWRDINDPTFTDNMPPDVGVWWPIMRDLDEELVTHILYAEDGELEVIVKRPDIAHTPGAIFRHVSYPGQAV